MAGYTMGTGTMYPIPQGIDPTWGASQAGQNWLGSSKGRGYVGTATTNPFSVSPMGGAPAPTGGGGVPAPTGGGMAPPMSGGGMPMGGGMQGGAINLPTDTSAPYAMSRPMTLQGGVPAANPYALTAQIGANQAGMSSGMLGNQNIGAAGMLMGAGGTAMNTAFDPQNALRDRETQRLLDQVRVGQAARGITSSPYGAGLENQALSNFALDWQDRQLGRQLQGLQGVGTAFGQSGNLGQMGVSQQQMAGALPYQAFTDEEQRNLGNWADYMNTYQGLMTNQINTAAGQAAEAAAKSRYNTNQQIPYLPSTQYMYPRY